LVNGLSESRLKLARFPWIKTLDQFDFDFQPSLDRKVVRELAGLSRPSILDFHWPG
jgi:DNA replication protein DnaC